MKLFENSADNYLKVRGCLQHKCIRLHLFSAIKYSHIVQLTNEVVCNEEISEVLKSVHVLNERDSVVGQIQHFKLLQRLQTLNFLDPVE